MWESRPTPQLRYFDQWLRQRQAEERLKMLITNPEGFFQVDEEQRSLEPSEESASDISEESDQPTLGTPVQQSLLTSETFASGTSGEANTANDNSRKKPKGIIALPENRQLDLFSKEQEG